MTQAQSAAVTNIQATTKWLIGAIGAVAFAVLAGVQLSAIGKLHGHRFDVALVWAGIAILGVLLALATAAQVLIPRPITLGALLEGRRSNLKGKLKAEPATAHLELKELDERRMEVAQQVQDCLSQLLEDAENREENSDVIERELTQLKDALSRVDRTIEAVEWLARYQSTRSRFRLTLVGLGAGIVLVLVGTLGFLSMTAGVQATGAVACSSGTSSVVAAAELDSLQCSQGARINVPERVTIKLTPAGISAYQAKYRGCVLHIPPNLVGFAISGTWTDPLVTVSEANRSGSPPCVERGSKFEMKPDYGSATPRR